MSISRAGDDAETLFIQLTGAAKSRERALGDVVLEGHYVEVKRAASNTINQVRAVKYATLAVHYPPENMWYVVPAHVIVRMLQGKGRGQHGENPFESAVVRRPALQEYRVPPNQLREAVIGAAEESARYPRLKALMGWVLVETQDLAGRSLDRVRKVLGDYDNAAAEQK